MIAWSRQSRCQRQREKYADNDLKNEVEEAAKLGVAANDKNMKGCDPRLGEGEVRI